MKTIDLRKQNDDDLRKKLDDSREELMQLRFQHATGALENAARMSHLKRDIARLLTVMNEQKRAAKASATEAPSNA